jgi:membrane-bound lytic murein transglycosylase D
VLDGDRLVPKGYKLRLPAGASTWTATRLAQQIPLAEQYIEQPRARSYKVRKGDSLADLAKQYALPVAALAKLNGLAVNADLKPGRTLRLPEQAPRRVAAVDVGPKVVEAPPPAQVAAISAPPAEVTEALAEQRQEKAAIAKTSKRSEAVSAVEAAEQGPSLVPGGAVARASESTDYSVGMDHTIRVAAEETLGHYADWLGIPASRLRSLNKLAASAGLSMGRQLKLEFSKATPAQFEARRREYHEQIEAAFYANHRITGTQVYIARRGDSLWNVAQRNGQLPAWLVLHYNPDVDFGALRAGLELVIPQVEIVTAG